MDIRAETPGDIETIYALTKAAFEPMPYSDGTEQDCVNKLRADGDLELSLVAIDQGRLVGHVAFSPVSITGAPQRWLGLGPVSVWPELQKTGIGSSLIKTGLEMLKSDGVAGCVLIGDPNYYRRFGFLGDGSLSYRDLADDVVQWLSFDGTRPKGVLTFSPGLE